MKRLVLIAAIITCAGCATTRPDHFWYADTQPQGAVVTTSIGLTCVTPCRLEISRWGAETSGFSYTIEKPGYETVRGQARVQTNDTLGAGIALSVLAAAAGSPIIPGPMNSKGYREIEPNPLQVRLAPTTAPLDPPPAIEPTP